MANFATTRWTLVYKAVGDRSTERRDAMQELLTRYMPAMRSYLVRAKRLPVEQADELLQGFVLKNILEGDLLNRADQTGGKFRSWVLKWLENYVRHELCRKRREVASGEFDESPDQLETDAFEVEWARSTLREALDLMRDECETDDKRPRWVVFQHRIVGPLLTGAEPMAYDELIRQLGLESMAQVQNLLVTAKRHFARSLETVVGRYADSQEEITTEIRDLRQTLVRVSASGQGLDGAADESSLGPMTTDNASAEQVAQFMDLDYRQVWQRHLDTPVGELLDQENVADVDEAHLPLRAFLAQPSPSRALLVELKTLGSAEMQRDTGRIPNEVALAIYLTAIAAAKARLGTEISRAPMRALRSSVDWLLAAPWLDKFSCSLLEESLA